MGKQETGATPEPEDMGLDSEAGSGETPEDVLGGAGFENKGKVEHPIKYPNAELWQNGDQKLYVSPAVEQDGVLNIWNEEGSIAFVAVGGDVVELPGMGTGKTTSMEELRKLLAA